METIIKFDKKKLNKKKLLKETLDYYNEVIINHKNKVNEA